MVPIHSFITNSSQTSLAAYYHLAIQKAETQPAVHDLSKELFLNLKRQGEKIPTVLTTSLPSKVTAFNKSIAEIRGYKSCAEIGTPIWFLGAIATTEIACILGHPMIASILCAASCFSTIATNYCLEKTCPSNRAHLRELAVESLTEIVTIFHEATEFSKENDNQLKSLLEKKVEELNNAVDYPHLNEEKALYKIALNDLLAVIAHYKIERFTLAVSETEQAVEETSTDSEDAAAPLLTRSGVQPMMIDRV
jgi:hypothetical protein